MNEVFNKVEEELRISDLSSVGLFDDLRKAIRAEVWKKFYEARDKGLFKKKIWFITVDFSDELAEKLTDWFGPDPLGGR